MNHETLKQEAIEAIKAGFADVLFEIVLKCTAPIYWYEAHGKKLGAPISNGTIFFVDAGYGPIAISARHVLDGYRKAVTERNNLRCQISSILFDPLSRLIAEDAKTDIVTFKITSAELNELAKVAHETPSRWPPNPPKEGQGIFFGGYPGSDRLIEGERIRWSFVRALDIASTVHDDHLTIKFERENWVCQHLVSPPPPDYEMGGVSGGPVFALIQKPIISWRIAGVLTEFSKDYEILFASTLNKIKPDGSII